VRENRRRLLLKTTVWTEAGYPSNKYNPGRKIYHTKIFCTTNVITENLFPSQMFLNSVKFLFPAFKKLVCPYAFAGL
jgi:hypothetical protein